MTTDLAPWVNAELTARVLTPTGKTPGVVLSPEDEFIYLTGDSNLRNGLRWTRADIALDHGPEHVFRIAEITGLMVSTIRQDKVVAKAYPYEYRVYGNPRPTFEHHKKLLEFDFGLSPDEEIQILRQRREILLLVQDQQLSVSEMVSWIHEGMVTTYRTPSTARQIERWFYTGYGLNVETHKDYIEFKDTDTTLVARFNGEGVEWETIHESMER